MVFGSTVFDRYAPFLGGLASFFPHRNGPTHQVPRRFLTPFRRVLFVFFYDNDVLIGRTIHFRTLLDEEIFKEVVAIVVEVGWK